MAVHHFPTAPILAPNHSPKHFITLLHNMLSPVMAAFTISCRRHAAQDWISTVWYRAGEETLIMTQKEIPFQ